MNAGQMFMNVMQGVTSVTPVSLPTAIVLPEGQQKIGPDFAELLKGMQAIAPENLETPAVKVPDDAELIDTLTVLNPQNVEMYLAAQMIVAAQNQAAMLGRVVDTAQNVPVSVVPEQRQQNTEVAASVIAAPAVKPAARINDTAQNVPVSAAPEQRRQNIEVAASVIAAPVAEAEKEGVAVSVQPAPSAAYAEKVLPEQPEVKKSETTAPIQRSNAAIPAPLPEQLLQQPVRIAEIVKPAARINDTAQNVPVSAAPEQRQQNIEVAASVIAAPVAEAEKEGVAVSVQPAPSAAYAEKVLPEQPEVKKSETTAPIQRSNAAIPAPLPEQLLQQPVRIAEIEAPDSQRAPAPLSPIVNPYAMNENNPDIRAEKPLKQGHQMAVKDMTSTTADEVPTTQTAFTADDSLDGGTDQEAPDQGLKSQIMAPLFQEQSKTGLHSTIPAIGSRDNPVRPEVPEQVVQQVRERLVQHDVKPGNQQITLTLSPESLGELKMSLNLQGQKLSVEIVAENRMVRDVIVQHTEALKESLARQNITMESFDVTTGGKGSGNQTSNQNAWRELARQQQQQMFWSSTGGYRAQSDVPVNLPEYKAKIEHAMLDIHY